MLCCISIAQGASVLFVVEDASNIGEYEVEYKYRLEQAGYNVIPMTYSDVTSSINLSGYGFVYWTDFTGEGISDPYADVMIDELVEQAVPFMSPNPKFAIKWGLGTNAHPNCDGTEWLWDQTDITVLDASHPIFNDIFFSGSLQVYRFGDIPRFSGVLADDSTLSPDAVKLASTYDSFYNVDELGIIEFPAGATQTDLSTGHAAPTAKFIHIGMGDETPDTNPYPPYDQSSIANDHENFWEIFVNAAYYLAGMPSGTDKTLPTITVLAWTTDDPNAEFIEKLAEKKPDVYFDSAHTKAEFFSKLRNGFYSVIFLANTKSANELTDPEINEIKGSLSSYDSIGKGLIVSGFGLKYVPELGGVLGDKYIGSLPMGEKFEIRPVVITEDHPITQGYEGTELSAVGWAVRVVPERSAPLARFEDIMPGNARGKPSYLKELPAVTVSAYGSGSGVLFAPDIGASSAEGFNEEEWLEMASRAIDWISASSGVGASIGIEKDANPKSITVKTTPSDKSNDNKHAKVRTTVKNTGSLDLFNVYVAETLPAGLTLINGTLDKSVGTLNVGDSYTFNYSFWVPADYPTTYELVTTVTSTDSRGKEHSFEQSLYLEVELPPGVNISRYKDNGSSIRIVKRLGKQGDKTKVTIDLLNRDKLPVKGVWIEETIPEEVYKETHTGVFSNNGLFWDLETVEKKASVEYFLRFPDVDEPTTYELKTVVEYQTLEDFKTLEEISYVTISPKGDIDLTEGKRTSKIKERGKGYSKVHMGSRHTKWGGGTSHGKKKGHDKDKGKPDKPPKDKDPGKGKKH